MKYKYVINLYISIKTCSLLNDHKELTSKNNQLNSSHMLKSPTLQNKLACLQLAHL